VARRPAGWGLPGLSRARRPGQCARRARLDHARAGFGDRFVADHSDAHVQRAGARDPGQDAGHRAGRQAHQHRRPGRVGRHAVAGGAGRRPPARHVPGQLPHHLGRRPPAVGWLHVFGRRALADRALRAGGRPDGGRAAGDRQVRRLRRAHSRRRSAALPDRAVAPPHAHPGPDAAGVGRAGPGRCEHGRHVLAAGAVHVRRRPARRVGGRAARGGAELVRPLVGGAPGRTGRCRGAGADAPTRARHLPGPGARQGARGRHGRWRAAGG
jgi:hypothetical protein